MHYVGMDVHSKVTMVCILDENGKIVKELVVKGSLGEVVAALRRLPKPFKVCYEASCGYGWLHDQIKDLARQVVVAHPGKLRLIFQSKRKNDRVDARKLAMLLFMDQVPPVHVASVKRRQWRAIIEYRQRLGKRRSALKCMVRALLREVGIKSPRGLWGKKGRQWLLEQPLAEMGSIRREMLLDEMDQLGVRIKRLERILDQQGKADPGVAVLRTAPGVGPRTAEAVVAYIDDASRFRRNKSVGCYFGMVPREDSSVKTRMGHITKDGPPTVRKLLTEACWMAIRKDSGVRAYYERVMRKDPDRKKIALVATAHHLLRAMHAMLRTGEAWREAVPKADVKQGAA